MPSDQPPHAPTPDPDPKAAEPPPAGPAARGPLWIQIRNDLAGAILQGVFEPRHRIPGVRQLREDYRDASGPCSASVVQRAVVALQHAGFVAESTSGSPWRVAAEPPADLPKEWTAEN